MKNSKVLFKYHLTVWGNLLVAAGVQGNCAQWLLANNARTTLFYLEAMTRLLGEMHDNKKFAKLNERFKLLEDSLGVMDYYAGLLKEFKGNANIPEKIMIRLETEYHNAVFKTNALLREQAWIGKPAHRMDKIKQAVKKIDWLEDEAFTAQLHDFYAQQLEKIHAQLSQPIHEVEADVHELRRDIRWLSIYPQAFKGFVTLKPARVQVQKWAKYLTPKIINSPFNQLAQVDDVKGIALSSNHFHAMSWVIDALGTLKDQGLRLQALIDGMVSELGESEDNAHVLALLALGTEQASKDEILSATRMIALQAKRDFIFSGMLVRA